MMKRNTAAAATTAAILALGVSAPVAADAASTAVTPIVVTVTGGVISITSPVAAVPLGTQIATVENATLSGSLGPVQVLDARLAGAGAGWVASVISTALTPTSGPTIGAALIGYTVGTITKVGTATYTANNPPNLTGVAPAITATGITGSNSATWNPTINVLVEANMAAGVYTGTITHSVL